MCLLTLKMGWEEGTLASGSKDKTIKIWNTSKGTLIRSLDHGHQDWIRSMITLPNGTIASSSSDSNIIIWNTYNGQVSKILRGHDLSVNCLIVLEDKLISGSNDKTIKIWNISTGSLIKTLNEHNLGWILCLAILSLNQIASGSSDSTIYIYDINDGLLLKKLKMDKSVWIKQILVISYIDKSFIASCSIDCLIRIYDLDKNKIKQTLNDNKLVRCINTLPDGRLVGAYDDKDIFIWNKPN